MDELIQREMKIVEVQFFENKQKEEMQKVVLLDLKSYEKVTYYRNLQFAFPVTDQHENNDVTCHFDVKIKDNKMMLQLKKIDL